MADVFISYSRADAADVEVVKTLLVARSVSTFFDRDQLTAGLPWPQALEHGLSQARAVVVFIGPHGLGEWQKREMYFALDRQVQLQKENQRYPVIPVLLPGSEVFPGFLFLNTWIEFGRDVRDPTALDALVAAIDSSAVAVKRPTVDVCPYLYLRAFREEDAALFFGRGEATADVLDRLDHRFVAIVAPSGLGKSSVLMAGVIPALRRWRPPQPTWDVAVCNPGVDPWFAVALSLVPLLEPEVTESERPREAAKLAAGLAATPAALGATIARIIAKSKGTDRVLVGIDQFEELLTQAPEAQRVRFLESLLIATRTSPTTIAVTLRADYYGRALSMSRELADLLSRSQVALGPLTGAELRSTIEQPAALVGLDFEAGLVDRIVGDVEGEKGGLALLEYALTALWQAPRKSRTLTHDAYTGVGGVTGAISERAETIYQKLTIDEQQATRHLFGRLVRVMSADEEGADTRRRATQEDVGDDSWAVAQKYAAREHRLLVLGATGLQAMPAVDVAHEAIIKNWQRLRGWLKEDRPFLLWRQQLAGPLSLWRETGAPLPPELTESARAWLRQRPADFTATEREFIDTGRQPVRGRRLSLVAAALASVAIVVFAVEIALVHLAIDFGSADRVVLRRGVQALADVPGLGKRTVLDTGLLRADVKQEGIVGQSAFDIRPERGAFLARPFVLSGLRDTPNSLLLQYATASSSASREQTLERLVASETDSLGGSVGAYRDALARAMVFLEAPQSVSQLTTLGRGSGDDTQRRVWALKSLRVLGGLALVDERFAAEAFNLLHERLADRSDEVSTQLVDLTRRYPAKVSATCDALVEAFQRTEARMPAPDILARMEVAERLAAIASDSSECQKRFAALDLRDVLWTGFSGPFVVAGNLRTLRWLIRIKPQLATFPLAALVDERSSGTSGTPFYQYLAGLTNNRTAGSDPNDRQKAAVALLGTIAAVRADLAPSIVRLLIQGLLRPTEAINIGAEPDALRTAVKGSLAAADHVVGAIEGKARSPNLALRVAAVQTLAYIAVDHPSLAPRVAEVLVPTLQDPAFGVPEAVASIVPFVPKLSEQLIPEVTQLLSEGKSEAVSLAVAVVKANPSTVTDLVQPFSNWMVRASNQVSRVDLATAFLQQRPGLCDSLVATWGDMINAADAQAGSPVEDALRTVSFVESNRPCGARAAAALLKKAVATQIDQSQFAIDALQAMMSAGATALADDDRWFVYLGHADENVRDVARQALVLALVESARHQQSPSRYFLDQLTGAPSVIPKGKSATTDAVYRSAVTLAIAQWIVHGDSSLSAEREALRADIVQLARFDERVTVRAAAVRTLAAIIEQERRVHVEHPRPWREMGF